MESGVSLMRVDSICQDFDSFESPNNTTFIGSIYALNPSRTLQRKLQSSHELCAQVTIQDPSTLPVLLSETISINSCGKP